ncbi:MAG: hypothetical protein RIM72_22845 [Alphaproteobacteria bacterium]
MTDLDGPDVWRLQRDATASGKIDRRLARQIRRAGTAGRSGCPCGVNPPCRCTGIAFGEFPGIDRPSRSAKTLFVYESTA